MTENERMNILDLYQDYHVQYWTEGKNVSTGWVNVACPFCADTSNHLGYNLDKNYFRCWKCGPHPLSLTLSRLLSVDERSVHTIIQQYGGRPKPFVSATQMDIGIKQYRLPSPTGVLSKRHRAYLTKRGFDTIRLETEWGLLGTGPLSILDGINYKFRIIAPIIWDGKQVSFQSRDITNHHPLRYMACPKPREIIHHKHILYGQQARWYETGICVEGITDVWRLGENAFATFGIEYTHNQVGEMAKHFERIAILFDDEPQAQAQAHKLMGELRFRGVKAHVYTIKGDPGGMEQKDADRLVREIVTKGWVK